MKKVITYYCEICNRGYDTEAEAIDCEEMGVFATDKFPQGLMFQLNHHGYVGIFAIPKAIQPTKGGYNKGHIGESNYWACRDLERFNDDSVGKEMCGHGFFHSDKGSFDNWLNCHLIEKERINGKEFKRMVAFLKSQNIRPCYYNKRAELIYVP